MSGLGDYLIYVYELAYYVISVFHELIAAYSSRRE